MFMQKNKSAVHFISSPICDVIPSNIAKNGRGANRPARSWVTISER
jgi:hypothetical protein